MHKYFLTCMLTILAFACGFTQSNFLKIDYSYGNPKIFGESSLTYVDNQSYSLGILFVKGTMGNDLYAEDALRTYFGLRYRHLDAGTPETPYGYSRYSYDYLEVPFDFEADIFSFFKRFIVLGADFGVFGAYPIKVKGEEVGSTVTGWSEEYEKPFFILGFSLGFFAGLNINDNISLRYGGFTQIPFIPISKSAPEDTPDNYYKTEVLTDAGNYFTLEIKLGDWEWNDD